MSLQYLKKEVRDEVDFLHANKHQNFPQVDFNTLNIKVFYKVILSLLMGIIKHSQSTQCNKLSIALHYLKNEVSHHSISPPLSNQGGGGGPNFERGGLEKKVSALDVLQSLCHRYLPGGAYYVSCQKNFIK